MWKEANTTFPSGVMKGLNEIIFGQVPNTALRASGSDSECQDPGENYASSPIFPCAHGSLKPGMKDYYMHSFIWFSQ